MPNWPFPESFPANPLDDNRLSRRFAEVQRLSQIYRAERAEGSTWWPKDIPEGATNAFRAGWHRRDNDHFPSPEGDSDD